MNADNLTKEHRILIAMRKVLSGIVRETTPPPGMRHPLSDSTIEDIKQCFALISAREKELSDDAGHPVAKPRYADEPRTSQVVQFTRPNKDK